MMLLYRHGVFEGKQTNKLLLVSGAGLILLVVSALTVLNTSFTKYEETRDSHCLNFLGGCQYVREKVLITEFKPFTAASLMTLTFLVFTFITLVVLFSIGDKGLSVSTMSAVISIGLFLFTAMYVGLYFYGSSRNGHTEVIGGLSYDESICLESSMTALSTGGEPRCVGDAADKPLDDYWKD